MLLKLHRQRRGLALGLMTLAIGAWLGLQLGACPMENGGAHACQYSPAGHSGHMGASGGDGDNGCCPGGACPLASPAEIVATPATALVTNPLHAPLLVASIPSSAAVYTVAATRFPPPPDYAPVHPLLRFCVLRI